MKLSVFITFLCLLVIVEMSSAQEIHIYGGSDHDEYLGCMNCNQYDSESIWNKFGSYGSKFSSSSIWNKFGQYGGEYSRYSPWNRYASDPPILVDKRGNFYGYFTINRYKENRAQYDLAEFLFKYKTIIMEDPNAFIDWYLED